MVVTTVMWIHAAVFLSTMMLLCVYIYSPNLSVQKTPETQLIRYILLWTDPSFTPLRFLGHGFDAFTANGCEYTNCYVTHNSSILRSVVDYDAIVFNGRHLPIDLPKDRSEKQKYVYANMESSHNYPVCDDRFDGFFNWTWTYKLCSDSRWGYITVYSMTGHVVGPKLNMHWPVMDPVDSRTKELLASKSLAAAWFVSNCKSKSRREAFAKAAARELNRRGLSLHVYGSCGKFVCPRQNASECNERLAKDYYFYFAFENSFSEDYVTEKVLTALRHLTVPVVFGAANYSRFLPPGSYVDARVLGPRRLAERLAAVIHDHRRGGSLYHDFFRWRNHYVFKETSEKEDVCKICELLNDPAAISQVTTYRHFRRWWNSEGTPCPAGL